MHQQDDTQFTGNLNLKYCRRVEQKLFKFTGFKNSRRWWQKLPKDLRAHLHRKCSGQYT